jgi:hypothetical protein
MVKLLNSTSNGGNYKLKGQLKAHHPSDYQNMFTVRKSNVSQGDGNHRFLYIAFDLTVSLKCNLTVSLQ